MDREKRKAINITVFVSLAIGGVLALIEYFWFDSKIIEIIETFFLIAGLCIFLIYNFILPIFKD